MYKSFTADDYRKHFKLPEDYTVQGFIVFGTFRKDPYNHIKAELAKLGMPVSYERTLSDEFFEPILEFSVNERIYWFTVAYGGTLLSEWTHLACLLGSTTNIVVGSCGGLLQGADMLDIVIPTLAYADESATRMYEPGNDNTHAATAELSDRLARRLSAGHKVLQGPTVTCQAMMAETWEDIQGWAAAGYYGVEMEAATVFAVSNHFKRRTAALLVIGDNLIQEKTILDVNFEATREVRSKVRTDMLAAALAEMLPDD